MSHHTDCPSQGAHAPAPAAATHHSRSQRQSAVSRDRLPLLCGLSPAQIECARYAADGHTRVKHSSTQNCPIVPIVVHLFTTQEAVSGKQQYFCHISRIMCAPHFKNTARAYRLTIYLVPLSPPDYRPCPATHIPLWVAQTVRRSTRPSRRRRAIATTAASPTNS